ncbi:hypothetical protein ABG768_021962 [Culter alburnus]|uniref:Uncharacterized protein n=1 Tax=Culter alburnus TaxID=194366 RepID=A0AAW2AW09_CULAL
MSLVHSGVVLQALSSFTGATVKHFSEDAQSGDNLHVFNFLPTIFANKPLQALSIFTDATDTAPLKCFCSELFVDIDNFLDPRFDYDFTDLTDDSTCMRGNEPYKRPCGWKRIAIKVLDKYPDGNAWLGSDGWRSYSVDGEWPVSYHGTGMNSAKAIIESHYVPGSGQRYGRGIYSTYDIIEATGYSHDVKCKETGKTYKVLLQNRINPKMRKVCTRQDYWLIEVPEGITSDEQIAEIVEKSIRPYGILFKEV